MAGLVFLLVFWVLGRALAKGTAWAGFIVKFFFFFFFFERVFFVLDDYKSRGPAKSRGGFNQRRLLITFLITSPRSVTSLARKRHMQF
jgi:hypothetical protein